MEQWKIDRINELARLAKSPAGLTEAQQQERRVLRQEYVRAVTGNLTAQLERVYFVEEDGTQSKLKKKDE